MHVLHRKTCEEKPFCTVCEQYQELRYHGRQLIPTWRYNLEKDQIDSMVRECPEHVISVEQWEG